MTPAALALLHAASFTLPRPWSEAEFAEVLAVPGSFLLTEGEAFLVGRVIAGEAELLTLAVPGAERRRGKGRALLAAFAAEAGRRGARSAFLEVAAGNSAALQLYRAAGWHAVGRRQGYYRHPQGGAEDALVLRRALGTG